MINRIDNLNERYVVCNKYNGKLRFVHKQWATPTYDSQYAKLYTLEEATIHVRTLNEKRKKCKFKMEKASKFFLNVFEAAFDAGGWNSSNTYEIILSNKTVALDQAIKNKMKWTEISTFKEQLNNKASSLIQKLNHEVNKQTEELQKTINEVKMHITTITNEVDNMNAIDINEFVKPYQTGCDTTYRVLYCDNK